MQSINITEHILMDMLGITLVEIRAHSNPSYAKVMADIFHNVPGRLILDMPPHDIYQDMLKIAKRHSVEKYLTTLLEHSSDKMGKQVKPIKE